MLHIESPLGLYNEEAAPCRFTNVQSSSLFGLTSSPVAHFQLLQELHQVEPRFGTAYWLERPGSSLTFPPRSSFGIWLDLVLPV